MLDLLIGADKDRVLRVQCIGAHCDDIEIGCGATLRQLASARNPIVVDWAVLAGSPARRTEAERSMTRLVPETSRGKLVFGDFPDGRFPTAYSGIKDFVECLKADNSPDIVLCHERDDRHQDHRMVNEIVWTAYRDHLILEYEVPKWDGGLGQPNVYVALDPQSVEAKLDALMTSYVSQHAKDWFTRDTFLALMRLRGIECRSPSGYAEAFYGRKLRLLGT